MRRHIEVLASDAFGGGEPGTEGENKTLRDIAGQFQEIGLEPAAGDGDWYQPVPLVERTPFGHIALWASKGAPVEFDRKDIVFLGTEARETTNDAPVWFVGQALPEQLAGVNLDGAVALILYDAPEGAPGYSKRAEALTKAGAAARSEEHTSELQTLMRLSYSV